MPFLEDLAQGLSAAAGSQYGVQSIEKRKQRRQALSDAELETRTQQILGDVQALNERRSKLDRNSPTYKQDLQSIDQALHDARGVFTDLYHPENNPGALAKLSGYIQAHLGRRKQQAAPATPAAAKQSISERMAGIESVAYAPGATQTPDKMAEIERSFQQQFNRPMTEEEKKQYFAHIFGGAPLEPKAPHYSDYAQGLRRFVEAEGGDPDSPTAEQEKAFRESRSAAKPPTSGQITLEAYENAFDPPVKYANMTPEQKAFFPRWKAMQTAAQTTGQSVMMIPQPNGSIMPVTVQRTSEKTFPGTQTPPGLRQPTSAAAPKTPAEAKSRISKPGAGVIAKGEPVGGRLTGPQSAAQKKYDQAVELDSLARQVAQKPDDAVNVKGFAIALERARANRFTTEALNVMLDAGWANKLQLWANKPTSGTLPRDILRQLVEGAHENLIAAQTARDEEFGTSGGAGGVKKRVSVKKAMALPENRGKTEAQVKQDIESRGYEAVP